VFTVETLAIGALAALLVGVSKTGMPGAGLVSIPLFASIVDGRLIPGTTLPVLIVADLFAVAWYRQHARWDVMRPLAPWIGLGYAAGSAFFIAVGSATGQLEVTIGVIVLGILAIIFVLRGIFKVAWKVIKFLLIVLGILAIVGYFSGWLKISIW